MVDYETTIQGLLMIRFWLDGNDKAFCNVKLVLRVRAVLILVRFSIIPVSDSDLQKEKTNP